MAEGKTIWEMFCDRWNRWFGPAPPPPPPPLEQQHYNPLSVKLQQTNSVTVDTMEFRKYTFVVDGMTEFKLNYKDNSLAFTDYALRATLQEGDPVNLKVRVYPHDTPGRDLQTLVFEKWDELDYDEGLKELLSENQFNTEVDEKIEASFWRINDTKTPYQAQTTEFNLQKRLMCAMDNDGKPAKVRTGETWYWDYWRETVDEGGTTYKEFLFVEWDKSDTGRFTIWRGREVPQSRISA